MLQYRNIAKKIGRNASLLFCFGISEFMGSGNRFHAVSGYGRVGVTEARGDE